MKKRSINIYSIYAKIIMLIIGCVVLFLLLNIFYIVPQSRSAIQKVTENNMQDIVTLSSQLVDDLVKENGEENTDYEVLKTRLEGKVLTEYLPVMFTL